MPIQTFLRTGISRPVARALLRVDLLFILYPLALSGVAAQAPVASPRSSSAVFFDKTWRTVPDEQTAWNDTLTRRRSSNYHREGSIIGATVGAIALAFVGNGLCQNSDARANHCTGTTVGSALLGAAAGFTLGLLVGGQIPKEEKVDSAAS